MICTNVKRIESLADTDVLEVTIDDTETALWIYPMTDAIQYVGKEVIVSYRNDMYKGNVRQFINTFVEPCKVSVLDRKEGIRLYAEFVDNYSNISFHDIGIGETKNGCIVYCVSQRFETSERAVWITLTVRDKLFRVSRLRLFNYDVKADFTGKYVMCAITRNEYGLRTDMIAPAQGECPDNYEISIAHDYVLSYFADDDTAKALLNGSGLLHKLQEHMDIEKGYLLVRLAVELSLCDSLYNVTNSVDIEAISHTLLADKLFVLKPQSKLSSDARNIILASGVKWKNAVVVMGLLDGSSDLELPERAVYYGIKAMAESVIRANKFVL